MENNHINSEDDELKLKRIEYYSASVNTWFATSMELDKSILTLSAGGIGILFAFQKDYGIKDPFAFITFIGALICFIISLISVLKIFDINREHIKRVLAEEEEESKSLWCLDKIKIWSFKLAIILTAVLVLINIASTTDKNIEEEKMGKKVTEIQQDSISGMKNIAPSKYQNSVNKMSDIKPMPASKAPHKSNGDGKKQKEENNG